MDNFNVNLRRWVAALLLLVSGTAAAQTDATHLVYFRDKVGTPYVLTEPEAYLSPRALARRSRQNIPIGTRDLPPNPTYVAQLTTAGAEVIYTSKWFNAAVVRADEATMTAIALLPFVDGERRLASRGRGDNDWSNVASTGATTTEDYGFATNQVTMLGADEMHARGYRGEGVWVAVFDAGFPGVPTIPGLAHLFDGVAENGTLRGTYDFVENQTDVYGHNSHGTQVLSCMAAYQPGTLIGTAPYADYLLFRTENAQGERTIEEINWLLAAERADSLGVDVINSSLGYTTFDAPSTSYTPADLDGETTLVTRAADFAAGTGMLVVNSAGNYGNRTGWNRSLVAPADGDSVLAVGGVRADSVYIGFSSRGPTADGRIKPDLVARAFETALLNPNGLRGGSNGTSFAAPLVAGLVAGFWQAYPQLTNMEVISFLKGSGTQAEQPDSLLGWGLPNFMRAATLAGPLSSPEPAAAGVRLYPTLVADGPLRLAVDPTLVGTLWAGRVYDARGRRVADMQFRSGAPVETLPLGGTTLRPGLYVLRLSSAQRAHTFRFVKQ
ncbi:MAG: S8 family peptidase [Catalinimonas sp.]